MEALYSLYRRCRTEYYFITVLCLVCSAGILQHNTLNYSHRVSMKSGEEITRPGTNLCTTYENSINWVSEYQQPTQKYVLNDLLAIERRP